MDFDDDKKCKKVDIDGFIEKGTQYDLEINLPEDNINNLVTEVIAWKYYKELITNN